MTHTPPTIFHELYFKQTGKNNKTIKYAHSMHHNILLKYGRIACDCIVRNVCATTAKQVALSTHFHLFGQLPFMCSRWYNARARAHLFIIQIKYNFPNFWLNEFTPVALPRYLTSYYYTSSSSTLYFLFNLSKDDFSVSDNLLLFESVWHYWSAWQLEKWLTIL